MTTIIGPVTTFIGYAGVRTLDLKRGDQSYFTDALVLAATVDCLTFEMSIWSEGSLKHQTCSFVNTKSLKSKILISSTSSEIHFFKLLKTEKHSNL
jgi:hypothetical protein